MCHISSGNIPKATQKSEPNPVERPKRSPISGVVTEIPSLISADALRIGLDSTSPSEVERLDATINPVEPNGKTEMQERRPANSKICEAYEELFTKLFTHHEPGREHYVYDRELAELAKSLGLAADVLIKNALEELRATGPALILNQHGRILDPEALGKHFSSLYALASDKVDFYVLHHTQQLESPTIPLSLSFKAAAGEVIKAGEAITLMLVKNPPESAALEIRKFSEKHLHGIMSLWSDREFQKTAEISPGLGDYLRHATVRILSTGKNLNVGEILKGLNERLEEEGGFEDKAWLRVVKGISQKEKNESLKQVLLPCLGIVGCVKLAESFMPGALHAIGGALDDLFGAIIPSVSQSLGHKDLSWRARLKHAMPAIKGGMVGLGCAFLLGWGSGALYSATSSSLMHASAGFLFALACCAGTIGTSVSALRQSWKGIHDLGADARYGRFVERLSFAQKCKLAFQEAILDVPFRIGQNLIGIPIQIATGIASGPMGFFHNSIFIMIIGGIETVLGAATAYAAPHLSKGRSARQLSRIEEKPSRGVKGEE